MQIIGFHSGRGVRSDKTGLRRVSHRRKHVLLALVLLLQLLLLEGALLEDFFAFEADKVGQLGLFEFLEVDSPHDRIFSLHALSRDHHRLVEIAVIKFSIGNFFIVFALLRYSLLELGALLIIKARIKRFLLFAHDYGSGLGLFVKVDICIVHLTGLSSHLLSPVKSVPFILSGDLLSLLSTGLSILFGLKSAHTVQPLLFNHILIVFLILQLGLFI